MRALFSILIFTICTLQSGCLYVARYDGTYQGKVVDEETHEPIEHAVVLAIWNTETPTLGGAVHRYYDIREVLTDHSGEFSIQGQGLRVMSTLLPANVLIFKYGYRYFGEVSWTEIITAKRDEVKLDGEKPVFSLKKLAIEDRKKRSSLPMTPGGPDSKMKLLLKEIDKEREDRALSPVDVGGKLK